MDLLVILVVNIITLDYISYLTRQSKLSLALMSQNFLLLGKTKFFVFNFGKRVLKVFGPTLRNSLQLRISLLRHKNLPKKSENVCLLEKFYKLTCL